MRQFEVGENAVYPGYGVAEVTAHETKEIGGEEHKFYVLRVLGKDMTLKVPVKNAETVGMRSLINDEQANEVFDVLKLRGEPISTATWNRRDREYKEKIRTGTLTEIARVMRDLYILRHQGKELSYGEKNVLETAKGLLVQELALARGVDGPAIEAEIDALFQDE